MEVPALYYHSYQLEACVLYTSPERTLDELNIKNLCKKVKIVLVFAPIWSAVTLQKNQIFPQH